MKKTPASIKSYLLSLDGDQRADGYLCLNEQQQILANDGWVGTTNLANIERTADPVQSIPILEGLLPANCTAPTVIKHAHVDQDYYFDIHLYNDNVGAWVLFIDKTHSAKRLQKEQQIRLTDDFKNDKPQTGS